MIAWGVGQTVGHQGDSSFFITRSERGRIWDASAGRLATNGGKGAGLPTVAVVSGN